MNEVTVDKEDLEHLDETINSLAYESPDLLDMPGLMHLRNKIAGALNLPTIEFDDYRKASSITDIYKE